MNKKQFFYRIVVYTKQEKEVSVVDIENPENKVLLEPWLSQVFLLADGQHTILELSNYLKKFYDTPPENFEETLESAVNRLIESKVITLSDKKVSLPYYLASPIDTQDQEKSRRLMHEDGYYTDRGFGNE